jgi:apolipoprotein D and lipocalin family protein
MITFSTNSKLRVSFSRPFYGDYLVLHLNKEHIYALVSTQSIKYLWRLSRDKKISSNIKNELTQKISELGFGKNRLLWTIQK